MAPFVSLAADDCADAHAQALLGTKAGSTCWKRAGIGMIQWSPAMLVLVSPSRQPAVPLSSIPLSMPFWVLAKVSGMAVPAPLCRVYFSISLVAAGTAGTVSVLGSVACLMGSAQEVRWLCFSVP